MINDYLSTLVIPLPAYPCFVVAHRLVFLHRVLAYAIGGGKRLGGVGGGAAAQKQRHTDNEDKTRYGMRTDTGCSIFHVAI